MVSTNPTHSSPSICDRASDVVFEGYERHTNENSIVRLSLAAEDVHGHNELRIYKQSVLPIAFSGLEGSTVGDFPNPLSSGQETGSRQNDVIYFDYATMEQLELYQTSPLQQVAGIQTVAAHWRSFRTEEKLKESLAAIYSQLRNINRIVIAVDHHRQRGPSDTADHCTSSPLGIYDMPHDTLLEYERETVNWCAIGRQIQQTIRDRAFWDECNSRYALEQIPSIGMNPPRIPQIYLARFSSAGDRERDLRLPTQLPSLVRDLAPDQADLEELWSPEQPEHPVFVDYSLRDLLD
ncbi:hypothetical protein O1611_g5092 [Lasiodiplodia mahajangana]|uniref:Uncharacterized protein n=1 Tax=Lasiodiplodia mahajangana TaxID=1108764 RepID=A0ACC2JLZ6_9PEZI|nr:hypothetical protein O1611_g5092 [Lasiodiplodia mahajangana]